MSSDTMVFAGLGLALIVAELFLGVSVGFDLVIIGVSFLVGAFATHYLASAYAGIVATGFSAAIYFFFLRFKMKSMLSSPTHKLNIDRLMGKPAVVTTAIGAHKAGQVKMDGEIWRAQSTTDIAVGEEVVIESVEGVTLHVITNHS